MAAVRLNESEIAMQSANHYDGMIARLRDEYFNDAGRLFVKGELVTIVSRNRERDTWFDVKDAAGHVLKSVPYFNLKIESNDSN